MTADVFKAGTQRDASVEQRSPNLLNIWVGKLILAWDTNTAHYLFCPHGAYDLEGYITLRHI